METTTFNRLMFAGMAALGTIFTTPAWAADSNPAKPSPEPSLKGNVLATTKEHKSVKGYLGRIQATELKIEALKNSIYENRMSDNDEAVMRDRALLKKAKADLKRDKEYLKVDKKTLMCQQHSRFMAELSDKKDHKKELREAKRTLRRDTRKDNTAAIDWDTKQVALLNAKVEEDNAQLGKIMKDRKEYLAYIEYELDEPYNETASASEQEVISDWVMLY